MTSLLTFTLVAILFAAVSSAGATAHAISLSCAIKIARALAGGDSAYSTAATAKFSRLLSLALDEGQISPQEIQVVIDSTQAVNPVIDGGHDRTRSFAFETGFDLLLNGNEGIDWDRIKKDAREMLRKKSEKNKERGRASRETRQLPQPRFVKPLELIFSTKPVVFEKDGASLVLAPTYGGLYVASLPDFKIQREIGKKLTLSERPVVFNQKGRLKAAVNESMKNFISVYDIEDGTAAPKRIKVPAKPSSAPAHYSIGKKDFVVFGSENPGLTAVNLTDGTVNQIDLKYKGEDKKLYDEWVTSEPKIYYEDGVPFALAPTQTGLWSVNLKTRKVAKNFDEVGDVRWAIPALYEKNGKNYAVIGAQEKSVIVNLSDKIVEKELPSVGLTEHSPVVFKYNGHLFAAHEFATQIVAGYTPKTGLQVIDLETNEIVISFPVFQQVYGSAGSVHVAYSELGYPYVIFQSQGGMFYMVDPISGTRIKTVKTAQSYPPELTFNIDGDVYYLVGSNTESQLFRLFSSRARP